MGRKGMKGFIKSAKHGGKSDSEDEAEHKATTSNKPDTQHAPAPASTSAPAKAGSDSDSGSDDESHSGPETRGHMVQRHKREMMAHKKALQKMGKKSKDELAKLTKEIEDRHAKELAELDAREKQTHAVEEGMAAAHLHDDKKPSKAQKRREKLLAAELEREARIKEEKANLGPTQAAMEEEALRGLLKPLGLAIRDIRADGHCMYRSLEDQLAQAKAAVVHDVAALRSLAAKHIRAHADDFLPFIYDEDEEGSPAQQLEEYCETLETTTEWGGQLELGALAQALKRQIKVYAVGMPVVTLGEEHAAHGTLQLCYMRHAFGLGEHYNSVQPLPAEAA